MTRLNQHSELFYLAHQLVEEYPQHAVSWFAVGCYYHMIADFENARRYFSKVSCERTRCAESTKGTESVGLQGVRPQGGVISRAR